MSMNIKGVVFDLDGVIVDTAKYHYLAWRKLAESLGFVFTEKDNERLKGVSRMASLNILLEIGRLQLDEEEKEKLAQKKNEWYVQYLENISEADILPGATEILAQLRAKGIKIALGSASKNAKLILNKLGLTHQFDVIIDGMLITYAKPNPEVFLKAIEQMQVQPDQCVIFEDAQAGIDAGNAIGCYTVGIGDKNVLTKAHKVVKDLSFVVDDFV